MSVKPSSHLWEVCISLAADLYSGYILLLLQLFHKQMNNKKKKSLEMGQILSPSHLASFHWF